MKRKLFVPILSLALGTLAQVHGAIVAAPVDGDLFVGFRASAGTGASSSLIYKIGSNDLFLGAAPGSSISLGNIGADLQTQFGTGWAIRANLFWGAFGASADPNGQFYASKERTNPAVQSATLATLTQQQVNATASSIFSVISSTNGYKDLEALTNPLAGIQANTGDASSYNYQVTRSGTDFGSLSQLSSIEGDFGGGAAGTLLDLYYQGGGGNPAQYLGYLQITDQGALTFTAVPEPSALALTALGSVSLAFGRRRKASRP